MARQPLDRRALAIDADALSPATDGDLAQIALLMNQAYRGGGEAEGWTTEAGYIEGARTSERDLRAEMAAKPEARFLLWRGEDDGSPLGCVWLEPAKDGAWYLGSLTVDPRQQNGGLGKRILAAAESWIAAQGGTQVRMKVVHIRDTLITWYQRRGYVLTGEREPFPYEDDRFGRPKRDDLAFVVLAKSLSR